MPTEKVKVRADAPLRRQANGKETLTIFSTREGNRSLERYAAELTESLGRKDAVRNLQFPVRRNFWGKLVDKQRYLLQAKENAAAQNLIVSVGDAFLLLALDGARTICVCHDVHPLLYPGRSFRFRMLYRLNLRLLKRAQAVVTVSNHTREQLLHHCPFLPPDRVFTVHNGVHSRWKPVTDQSSLTAFRVQHGLGSIRFILHVGNDNWYKNFGSLLRAFAQLEEKELMLVKVGSLRREEADLISELRLQDRILHFSCLSDEELVLLYNCAEVLVFPSLQEGFGWPPIEAMACGCPVIAARRASLPEICGEAALYVDPESPAEMCAAIERLHRESEARQTLIRSGIAQAAKYTWEKASEEILTLFDSKAVIHRA